MNDQLYRSPVNTPEFVEETDKDNNTPVVTSDPFADNVPVDEAMMNETPMGGTVASVGPLNETIPAEIPLFETPDLEIPMGGTVAAVGPMDETIVNEALIEEVVPLMPLADESIPGPTWESKISDLNPYDDPMDEKLRQEEHVATTGGLAN